MRPTRPRRRRIAAPFVLCTLVAAPHLASEKVPPVVTDERSLAYQHDPELGWFPKPNSEISYTGSRTISVRHNSLGFRDREHPAEKTRPRIAFVGDSFVWGYDAEADERFTDRLAAEIEGIDILNLGVSGYGTDQCYLLVRKFFDRLRPDIVLYFFSETDVEDNRVNFNYDAYYKPYFVLQEGELELRGVPVPLSLTHAITGEGPAGLFGLDRIGRWMASMIDFQRHPRVRNRKDLTPELVSAFDRWVRSRGASFAVGLVDDDPALRRHMQRQGIVFFDLSPIDQRYRYPAHGFHWTPQGHRLVARAVKAFLIHNRILPED